MHHPTSNSMKHPLVHWGPYLFRIFTTALVLGKTGHLRVMLPKLSTATMTFHTQPAHLGFKSTLVGAAPIELIDIK